MRSKLANNITFAKQKYHAERKRSISLKLFTTYNFYAIIISINNFQFVFLHLHSLSVQCVYHPKGERKCQIFNLLITDENDNEGVGDMKKVLTKIPAVIGMILTLICIFYLLKAYAYSYFPDLFDDGSNIYDPEMTAWGRDYLASWSRFSV